MICTHETSRETHHDSPISICIPLAYAARAFNWPMTKRLLWRGWKEEVPQRCDNKKYLNRRNQVRECLANELNALRCCDCVCDLLSIVYCRCCVSCYFSRLCEFVPPTAVAAAAEAAIQSQRVRKSLRQRRVAGGAVTATVCVRLSVFVSMCDCQNRERQNGQLLLVTQFCVCMHKHTYVSRYIHMYIQKYECMHVYVTLLLF